MMLKLFHLVKTTFVIADGLLQYLSILLLRGSKKTLNL